MCQDTEYKLFLLKLGNNIRKMRKDKGLSQESLAFSINSARNYIGCIERAEKTVSLRTLFKIAQTLDVNIEDLLK